MKRNTGMENPDRLQAAWQRAREAAHRSIITSSDISRGDRELLIRTNRIRRLMKGWYTLEIGTPSTLAEDGVDGIAAPVFYDFLGLYLEDRLGSKWCLSAESSLLFRLDTDTIPQRIIALSEYGSTTHHRFDGLTELTVYRDPDRFPRQNTTWAGLRLMSAEDSLSRLKPSALERDPQLIQRALPLVRDWDIFSLSLAQEGRQTAAIRLVEDLVTAGMGAQATRLQMIMSEAGFPIHTDSQISIPAETDLSGLWAGWSDHFPVSPSDSTGTPSSLLDLLSKAQELAPVDAIRSLAISGFHLTGDQVLTAMSEPERAASAAGWPELEEHERLLPDGHQDPLPGEADPQALLALQGYVEAGRLVKRSIVRLLEDEPLDRVLSEDIPLWHEALLLPACDAGFISDGQPGKFRGEETQPLDGLPQGPDPTEISANLDLLWELAAKERDPAHRALLAHLGLNWIRPWGNGNGRMARFLLNALRMAGKQNWLVIQEEKSGQYQDHLAEAMSGQSPESLFNLLSK